MRMAFGLISVLVTIGIIILIMSMMLDSTTGSIPAGIRAQDEARQISGHGEDGQAATQSAHLVSDTSGGKLRGLTVKRVIPGGAYDTYFGLMPGDTIVEIEQSGSMMKVNDISNGDSGLAKALVSDSYARNQRIIVEREGQRLTLPLQPGAVVAAAPGAPTTAPAAPAAPPAAADAPPDDRNPLVRQLDKIREAAN